jgi:hypothetical protein
MSCPPQGSIFYSTISNDKRDPRQLLFTGEKLNSQIRLISFISPPALSRVRFGAWFESQLHRANGVLAGRQNCRRPSVDL